MLTIQGGTVRLCDGISRRRPNKPGMSPIRELFS